MRPRLSNLVRGLQNEIKEEPEITPVLEALRDRAERILKDLETGERSASGTMGLLAALTKENEEAVKSAQDSGLSTRAYGVYWAWKENEAIAKSGISTLEFATRAEALVAPLPERPGPTSTSNGACDPPTFRRGSRAPPRLIASARPSHAVLNHTLV